MRDIIACASFEDRSFFVDPPANDASIEEWEKWMEKDKTARTAAKAAHTRAINTLAEESEENIDFSPDMPQEVARKVGGVYKQGQVVGFAGDSEEGTCTVEPAQDAQQTKLAIMSSWAEETKRGSKSKSRVSRKRKARRARKAKGGNK